MTDNERIELATQFEYLAQDNSIKGARIQALYDRLRNDPKCCMALLNHVGARIIAADKDTIALRTAARLIRDTMMTYENQRPEVIDQLVQSHRLIADRQGLRLVKSDETDGISYLGDPT